MDSNNQIYQIGPSSSITTSTTSPIMSRVYVDMNDNRAENQVAYRSDDGSERTSTDSLENDVRYRFSCRCGCGAKFSGLGRDIKASCLVGRSKIAVSLFTAAPLQTDGTTSPVSTTVKARPEKRPFVSDRFVSKSFFGMTDDEIDERAKVRMSNGEVDPAQKAGGGFNDDDCPATGDVVRTKSTREGPYTLIEFTIIDVTVSGVEGNTRQRVYGAILRSTDGSFIKLPVADLVKLNPDDVISSTQPAKRTFNVRRRYYVTLLLLAMSMAAPFLISLISAIQN